MAARPKRPTPYGALQRARLAELRRMTPEQWRKLRAEMAQATQLPKLQEHFRKHGSDFADMGIADPQQMQALFLEHVRRSDLKLFTYVSTQSRTHYRLWVLIGMDNGVVALYNESKQRHWSFMRPASLQAYMNGNRGLWVHVEEVAGKVRVRKWQPL